MKNLSGNANWFNEKEEAVEEKEEIIDPRVFLSYTKNEVSYFLTSDGKPIVFSDRTAAEIYLERNAEEGVEYEIDDFQGFDFTEIDIVEI